jgi:adenylylsulfate kinase
VATTSTGFIIWFTGLSGSGKTTIARILEARIRASGRNFESLDGDVVRTNLSKGLGFSKADRDTNIRRIGFVAHLLERNGVAVICSAISPYRQTRDEIRMMVGDHFIEVFADCPLDICATRDGKVEMYEKARRGEIKEFTGVSDPYEPPETPEVHLRTHAETPEESAEHVLAFLVERGYLSADALRQTAVQ